MTFNSSFLSRSVLFFNLIWALAIQGKSFCLGKKLYLLRHSNKIKWTLEGEALRFTSCSSLSIPEETRMLRGPFRLKSRTVRRDGQSPAEIPSTFNKWMQLLEPYEKSSFDYFRTKFRAIHIQCQVEKNKNSFFTQISWQ